jgi:protease I
MKKIAILAGEGYEDLELWYPRLRFTEMGYTVKVASEDGKERHGKHGYPTDVHMKTYRLKAADFDAVIVPGGIQGAENLRMDIDVIRLIRQMHAQNKVIAPICHGAWVLVSADIARGRRLTCFAGIKDDLIAAGARYEDREVVVDGNLITSRMPADLPAFMAEIIKKL